MSRTLAIGVVLFSGMVGVSAQAQPEVEPRVRIHAAVGERMRLSEESFDNAVFQQYGRARARQRFDVQLNFRIAAIDGICRLTETQKDKLRLAGRGDIARFFDRFESVKQTFQSREHGPQILVEFQQAVRPLQAAVNDLFQEDSLLYKTLPNTLTAEQRAAYEAMVHERRAFANVRLLEGHHGQGWGAWVTRLAVAPNGRQVVTVAGDAVRLWDLETGKAIRAFGHDRSGYWAVAFSPDGSRIAAGSNDHTVRIWDPATGKEVQRLRGHTAAVWGVAFVAGGRQLVTGAWDQSLRLWDVDTGKQVRLFEGVRDHVRCLACSPDGQFLAAGHFSDQQPGTLRLCDLAQGKEIRTFRGHTQEISSVAFSPDGRMLLTSSYDQTVRLWDVATGNEIRRFVGHSHRVEGAAFSPDGRYIASCGNQIDATVRIWDATEGQQLLCSEMCDEGFLAVAFAAECGCVVTAGKDGLGRLWPWERLKTPAK